MKNTGIVLANEIAEATKSAMFDDLTGLIARDIVESAEFISNEEMISKLFKYSAHLLALCANNVVQVILTESEINDMIGEIQMFDDITREVLGE